MNNSSAARKERYKSVAKILHEAARPLKVLSALGWPGNLREEFLASGGNKLPHPTYKPLDPAPVIEVVNRARALIQPGEPIEGNSYEQLEQSLPNNLRDALRELDDSEDQTD